MHIFAHDQLKRSDERCLKRSDAYLAVPLTSVTIAGEKQRASHVDWNEKRCTGNQFFVIEIPA
jgi:hypothetical protein